MKTLSIQDLLKEGINAPTGVWAINSASNSELGMKGDLYLQVPKLNGSKMDPLKIEQTWLAQDLTRKIPRAQLLESSEFRNLVESNLITLVTEEYAKRVNTREGAELERRRLQTSRMQPKELEAARKVSMKAEITRADGVTDDDDDGPRVDVYGPNGKQRDLTDAAEIAAAAARGLDLDESGLSPTFVMFANKLKREPDMSALNALRSHGKITSKELRHLRNNLPKHPLTVKAIKAQLLARKHAKEKKQLRAA
jgi:hypothetical protein